MFYKIFVRGLITLLPITVTIYLLVWIATQTERIFAGPLSSAFPAVFGFPGAGFLVGICLIFLVGLLVNSFVTQRFFEWFEARLENVPVVRSIYSPIRDITNLFGKPNAAGAGQRVVMVQLESGGIELLGLVTRDQFTDLPAGAVPEGSVAVFVPFSYGMGGFTVLVPKSRVRETAIPAERAMQLAITGWIKAHKH